jgi:hypothetical protein
MIYGLLAISMFRYARATKKKEHFKCNRKIFHRFETIGDLKQLMRLTFFYDILFLDSSSSLTVFFCLSRV